MDFGRGFSFLFEDAAWFKKLSLIALVSLIPLVGPFIVLGWALEITRNIMRGTPPELPDLDFGEQLSRGFSFFIGSLVYSIPLVVLAILMSIMNVVLESSSSSPSGAFMLIYLVLALVYFVVAVAYTLIHPAIAINFVANGERVGAALDFGAVLSLAKQHVGQYLLISLVVGLAGSLLSVVGMMACFIGILWVYAYLVAVTFHLYGQTARDEMTI